MEEKEIKDYYNYKNKVKVELYHDHFIWLGIDLF